MLWDGGGGGVVSFMLPIGVRLRRRGVLPSAWLLARPYPCVVDGVVDRPGLGIVR